MLLAYLLSFTYRMQSPCRAGPGSIRRISPETFEVPVHVTG